MIVSRRRLFFTGLGVAGCTTVGTWGSSQAGSDGTLEKMSQKTFSVYPVGIVEKSEECAQVRVFEAYWDALDGLKDFSHAFVLYWFDRNDTPQRRSILRVHPRGNKGNPLTGVFACRAPVRPNLIALTLCKILSVQGGVVRVDRIDAFDGSPVLDIKPYIPSLDRVPEDTRVPGWLNR